MTLTEMMYEIRVLKRAVFVAKTYNPRRSVKSRLRDACKYIKYHDEKYNSNTPSETPLTKAI
jgi:hypothetical protein